MPTYSPTVLVVDDDPTFVRYMRREFHNNTSVGVLVAKDIREGRTLAESESIKIDALVIDLFFDQGKDLPTEELYDGVDLAAAVKKKRPDLPTYFLSFFAEDAALHEKAQLKGVTPVRWLPKVWLSPRRKQDQQDAPWRVVEMDMLERRLKEPASRGGVPEHASGEALSLVVQLRRPLRTFLQTLPDPNLRITKPIEVICTLDEDMAKAVAPALGLLEEGYGESVEDALESLAVLIQRHYHMLSQHGCKPADYAGEVLERLRSFVSE